MDAILQDTPIGGTETTGSKAIYWILGIGIIAAAVYFFIIKK
jgi:hypothetical protein